MFDQPLTAKFGQPKFVSVNANHEQVQRVHFRCEAELTDGVAAGIGGIAGVVRKALIDGDAKKSTLELGVVYCKLEVDVPGRSKGALKLARSTHAVAKARKGKKGDEEPPPPVVELHFEMAWADADALLLANAAQREARVTISKAQTTLPGTD